MPFHVANVRRKKMSGILTNSDSDSDSDSDKFIQQKYIAVPYQVYMSFLEIQITL